MTSGNNTLTDAIRFAILYQLNNTHTSLPGSILSYDFATQKATVQPTINKQLTNGQIVKLPVLENVPVIFPASGGASLTMPVLPGDTCLLIFCERSIDDWITEGGDTEGVITPSDPRKFDMSDAVCIVGLKPFSGTFPPRINNTDLLLNLGTSSLALQPAGKVALGATGLPIVGTVELFDALFVVFTALKADPALWATLTTSKVPIELFIAKMLAIKGVLP